MDETGERKVRGTEPVDSTEYFVRIESVLGEQHVKGVEITSIIEVEGRAGTVLRTYQIMIESSS